MANLPALPNSAQLPAGQTPYGVALTAVVTDNVAALYSEDGNVVVNVDAGTVNLFPENLTPANVPYVNRFIAHLGVVKKNWRTESYDLKTAFVSPAPRPRPVALTAVPEAPAPSPVIVVAASDDDSTDSIPGLEVLPKVKVKAVSKGYVAIGDVVVPDKHLKTLQDGLTLANAGLPAAVLVTGPAGTAKTLLVKAFAASVGLPYLKVDGGSIRTADDWSGALRQDPNTEVWAHRWSPFAQVLRAGKPALLHIDEVTRTESPQALNALLGLLDKTGTLTVVDANTSLRLPVGVLVVATANIGPEFVGTLPLDGAVRQRFPNGVRLDYAPEKVEAKLLVDVTGVSADIAGSLVRMASQQRLNRNDPQQYPSGGIISTRVIVDIANRISRCGTAPRDAVLSALEAQFDPEDQLALSVIVDTQFPVVIDLTEDVVTEATPEDSEDPVIVVGKHYYSGTSYAGGTCTYPTRVAGILTPCGKDQSSPSHF